MASIPKLFLDNRINCADVSTSVVRISGQQVNYFSINPDGSSFPSQIVFNNIITPSLSNTLVGKNIRLRYQVAVAAGTNVFNMPKPAGSVDAEIDGVLRAYPLQSIANSITLTINGSSSVVSQRQILSALQRTEKKSLKKATESEAPTQADNLSVLVPDAQGRLSGQVLSPYQNSDGATRGSFVAYAWSGTNTNTYYFDVCESVMVSPLTAEPNEVALPNINTLSLQINYNNLVDMTVFGSVGGTGATPAYPPGLTVQILNPVLELVYFSVANSLVHIPRMYETDYTNFVYFPKAQTAFATNAVSQQQVQSDTLRFTSTPALIYIWLRPQLSLRDAAAAGGNSYADFCFPLGAQSTNAAQQTILPGINITFGNRSGLLSSMSVQQAYKTSVRNGLDMTWREWINAGCVLVLNPTLDFGLDLSQGDTIPGSTGSVNFQFQATYNNANLLSAQALAGGNGMYANSVPTELVIAVAYAGKCVLTADNCVFTTGFLSEAEIDALLRTAPNTGEMTSDEVLKPSIQGAGLFGKMKSVLGHVARGVGAAAPIISAVAEHPLVKKLAGGAMQGGIMSAAGLRRR
jgi:hypothetical protein